TCFWEVRVQSAYFQNAVVDASTLFVECWFDQETDFRNVGLSSARIDPGTKQLLEYNIRRKNWGDWYPRHPLLRWPVWWFWCLSNYGLSTWRVIIWFLGLAVFFAAIYANCACWWPPGIVNNLDVEPHLPPWHYFLLLLLRPIYFSIVTMTTLGFGDMYANAQSIWGHILLTIQVILGYVLLAALVTRFAVLFTAGGPAGTFADDKEKESKKEKVSE
ncbi:MAG: two pore domain potassium channel family protein, partial [Phycisphaerales bacterium]